MNKTVQTLKEKYGSIKPDGIAYDSAFSGTLFFYPGDNSCDYVTCREICGKRTSFHRSNIVFQGGREFIRKNGKKVYLENVVRC